MRHFILPAAIITLFSSCLKEGQLKLNNDGFSPIKKDDGWQLSTLKLENIDSTLIVKAYDYFYSEKVPMSKSLIVIRNGKIVAEAYAKNLDDINQIENIQSCTKSIVSLLIGVAMKKKLIQDLNTPLYDFYPEYFDSDLNKRKITIRHCLTMESGLSFSGGNDSKDLVHTKENSLRFVLKKPLISPPGTSYLYSDFNAQLISGVLNKVSGKSVEQFAYENLFSPLGITNYHWEKANDGLNLGAFSLYLKPRDLGKIGQLCLQKGVWNTQVIFENWIEQASFSQTRNARYGYFFGINVQPGSYSMIGNGRQTVFISPGKALVIVHTAFPYTSIPLWGDINPIIENIYNACN